MKAGSAFCTEDKGRGACIVSVNNRFGWQRRRLLGPVEIFVRERSSYVDDFEYRKVLKKSVANKGKEYRGSSGFDSAAWKTGHEVAFDKVHGCLAESCSSYGCHPCSTLSTYTGSS